MFWSKNKGKKVYHCIPHFCYIEVGYEGVIHFDAKYVGSGLQPRKHKTTLEDLFTVLGYYNYNHSLSASEILIRS